MPRIKCQLRPNGRSFCLFSENRVGQYGFRILNLEEQQNCMMGSKVTTILPPFFSKNSKTSNVGICGVYPEARE